MLIPDPDRNLYSVRNQVEYFGAGRTRSGEQVLLGIQLPELVCIAFDKDGNYLHTTTKALSEDALLRRDGNSAAYADNERLSPEIERRQIELGLTPGTIQVRRFQLPERTIAIKDLPDHYRALLDELDRIADAGGPSPAFREEVEMLYGAELGEVLEDIRQWQEQGDFVLVWDQEYYMNVHGQVIST